MIKEKSIEYELGDLLAVLHRDGGHHQVKVGTLQAIKDAHELLHKQWVLAELQSLNKPVSSENYPIEEKMYTKKEVQELLQSRESHIKCHQYTVQWVDKEDYQELDEWFEQNVK